MNVIFHDKAKQGEREFGLLEEATEKLRDVLKGAKFPVEAEWDRVDDARGRALYTLKLRDDLGEVERQFGPDEFKDTNQLNFRVYQTLSNLLRERTFKLIEERDKSNGEEDGHGPNP